MGIVATMTKPRLHALLLLGALAACTRMPADGLFEFATEAERLAGDVATAPVDAATLETGGADAADVLGSDADAADDAQDALDGQADADVPIPDDATGADADVAIPDGETASDAEPGADADATDVSDVAIADAVTAIDAADGLVLDVAADATPIADDTESADALADDATSDVAVTADADATATDAAVDDVPVVPDAGDVTPDAGEDAIDDLQTVDVAVCVPADCNDGNTCTADACDNPTGCSHLPLPGGCDDGNPCTTGDSCDAGVCLAGAATSCDDGNACTADACITGIGCSNTPTTADCSDGDACTLGDVCSSGACLAGAPMVCVDGNPCTSDVCQTGVCVYPAVALGVNCGPGQSCNAIQQCVANDLADMIALAGGTFVMGAPDGQGGANEQPQHVVSLASFALDKTEVTVAQYATFFASLQADQQCSAANGPTFTCARPDVAGACNWAVAGLEKQPVNCVDWFQATAYCAWAGKRLPTEAEWEYAARSGGLAQTYPWGDQPADCTWAILDDGSGAGGGCGGGGTAQPCSKAAGNSVQGACDLAGNVSEWCADWYDLYESVTTTDPAGPVASPEGTRVLRGGAWNSDASGVRASARASQIPSVRTGLSGFRCVSTL